MAMTENAQQKKKKNVDMLSVQQGFRRAWIFSTINAFKLTSPLDIW